MKKYILTENQFKSLTNRLISEDVGDTTFTVTLNFKSPYKVGDANPQMFVDEFAQTMLKKINSAPEGQKMLKSGKMTLQSLRVESGASNTWLNQTTPYDFENDYRTKPKSVDVKNPLYQKNVKLSKERASNFRPYLMRELKKYGINDSQDAQITTTTKVINTGGVKDETRNTSKYPNIGQYLYVVAVFKYSDGIVPVSTGSTTTGYTTVESHMVLTGSYYCNGKSSEGKSAQQNVFTKQCQELPDDKKDGKHMSTFEIKWNEDVVKDARVRPLLRWSFVWGNDNKIKQVVRISGTKPEYVPEGTAPKIKWEYKNISGNDPELIHYMNINGVDVHGQYIKPNL